MQYHEVSWKCTVLTFQRYLLPAPSQQITSGKIPDDRSSRFLWNVGTLLPERPLCRTTEDNNFHDHHWEKPRCCEWREDHSVSTTFTVTCLVNLGHELLDKLWTAEVLFWFPSIILMWEALPVNEKFSGAIFLEMNLHHFVHLHRRPTMWQLLPFCMLSSG